MSKKAEMQESSGLLVNLLVLGLIVYGLHWFVVSVFAKATISECKEEHAKFNSTQCQCIKGELRNTLEVELFLIDSIQDQTDRNLIVRKLLGIKHRCKSIQG